MDKPFDWMKYVLAALVIHAAVLCVPIAHKATEAVKQRVIDVVVMRQETPPPPPPQPEKKAIIRKPEPAKVRTPAQIVPPERAAEKKEEQKPLGGGNVLDETIVPQVAPGPATGDSEGVGVAGANVAGGKIGLGGGGGTGSGTAAVTGSGSVAAPAGPPGPVDMRLGEPGGPQFLVRENPEYPGIALKMRREGRAVIRVTIDEKGKLMKAEILETTDQFFGQSALAAAKDSKYVAAKRNGVAFAARVDIPYKFSLSK